MQGYDASTYGDRIAAIYDDLYGELFDAEATADTLFELAAGGEVLELAIGTGRIALPLAERGVRVSGIDASDAMVEKLRAKPGGSDIPVTRGDFSKVGVDGSFALIYVVFNTLFALTTQEEQVQCVKNVAEKLEPGGCFVTECFFPDLTRFTRHQNTEVIDIEVDRAMLDVSRHDPVKQTVKAMHIVITENGTKLYPVVLRYIYPSELDLMAHLAGLTLEHRWGGWHREPFTSDSKGHVSVFRKH